MRIAVIGESVATKENYKNAEEVGALLSEKGITLICGGLSGVMEAASKGAKSKGGQTIGILPSLDFKDANKYIDIPIVTGIGHARNFLVVRNAQAIIAIGGWHGTLTEIGYALDAELPVIGLNTWQLEQKTHPPEKKGIYYVQTPKEAVDLAIKLAK
ncbi:MAG: TIGR00725 family protein [Candidatus Margulisbacteria bacterium]|nr:TIGR00725 family protein [Candidatus Margulisiibacteriota bacterium]